MNATVTAAAPGETAPWRERYRQEMGCQIVHDSLHAREGWTESWMLRLAREVAGYGSVLVGGPWTGTRTVFEFYVAPGYRARVFHLFAALLATTGATRIETQANDTLLTVMLHAHARDIVSEKIVYQEGLTTSLPANGAVFRRKRAEEAAAIFAHAVEPAGDHVLEREGKVIATGGVLFHYNPPYGDVFMEVAPAYRRRGFGGYLVQELKRICRERGSIPCARCDVTNVASRQTCQKAGFVPCAHLLSGVVNRAQPAG